tara:strand:+ start:217 stop:594 length:378 start_codon:yes stop_codon:yes gene_type:complete
MKLPKFLAVGLLGTISNLTLFYIFVDRLMFPALQISIITFLIASLQNYILNHFWTFTKTMDAEPPKILNYFRFLFVAMIGLFVNLLILWWFIETFDPTIKVIAQAFGIAGGTMFNFLGSKYWVFK